MLYNRWITKGINLDKSKEDIVYQGEFIVSNKEQYMYDNEIVNIPNIRFIDKDRSLQLKYSALTEEKFKQKTMQIFKLLQELEISSLRQIETKIIKMKVNK
jgi:hypothetical protein